MALSSGITTLLTLPEKIEPELSIKSELDIKNILMSAIFRFYKKLMLE